MWGTAVWCLDWRTVGRDINKFFHRNLYEVLVFAHKLQHFKEKKKCYWWYQLEMLVTKLYTYILKSKVNTSFSLSLFLSLSLSLSLSVFHNFLSLLYISLRYLDYAFFFHFGIMTNVWVLSNNWVVSVLVEKDLLSKVWRINLCVCVVGWLVLEDWFLLKNCSSFQQTRKKSSLPAWIFLW